MSRQALLLMLAAEPDLRFGVTPLQSCMCLQTTLQCTPMYPVSRLELDECQPLLHPGGHLFV